jgi:hypothetical protein
MEQPQMVGELCPGAPLSFDIEVPSKLIENRVKWPPRPSRSMRSVTSRRLAEHHIAKVVGGI